jgi:hypothetical protein
MLFEVKETDRKFYADRDEELHRRDSIDGHAHSAVELLIHDSGLDIILP